jgi:hypothetical protein
MLLPQRELNCAQSFKCNLKKWVGCWKKQTLVLVPPNFVDPWRFTVNQAWRASERRGLKNHPLTFVFCFMHSVSSLCLLKHGTPPPPHMLKKLWRCHHSKRELHARKRLLGQFVRKVSDKNIAEICFAPQREFKLRTCQWSHSIFKEWLGHRKRQILRPPKFVDH